MTRIKQARLQCNLGQKEVALNLGVTQPTVSAWERGSKTPSAESYKNLAELFHVSVDWLLESNIDSEVPMESNPFEQIAEDKWLEAIATPSSLEDLRLRDRATKNNKALSSVAKNFLSVEEYALLSEYNRAPDNVKREILNLLSNYSGQTLSKIANRYKNMKLAQLKDGDISQLEYLKWELDFAKIYDTAKSGKITAKEFDEALTKITNSEE